jgi:hypothetical protein
LKLLTIEPFGAISWRSPPSQATIILWEIAAMRWLDRGALWRLLTLLGLGLFIVAGVYRTMIMMPGQSYRGELPPLSLSQQTLAQQLKIDVERIASVPHHYLAYEELVAIADYLEAQFTDVAQQRGEVERQDYPIAGQTFSNLILDLPGQQQADEIVVIGAHYDSVDAAGGVPGANDNGSGVAAVLALARHFAEHPQSRTLRFVAFTNEEPPFFQTENMGSLVYAQRCRERGEAVVGMLSLETMGYYDDAPGSQTYPLGLLDQVYPIQGNFISFVGNLESAKFVRQVVRQFRQSISFPSEGAILPGAVPGAGWSDHWAFWQQGYPALMVTDTAPFRYPYYHTPQDTSDKIDYDRLARVVEGLQSVISDLGDGK